MPRMSGLIIVEEQHEKKKHSHKHHKSHSKKKHTHESHKHHHHSSSSRHAHSSHPTYHGEGSNGAYESTWQPPNAYASTGYRDNRYYDQQYQGYQRPSYPDPWAKDYQGPGYPDPWATGHGDSYNSSSLGYGNDEPSYSTATYSAAPQPSASGAYNNTESSGSDIPDVIQQAISRGNEVMRTLRDTIRVVLLHEWCMSGNEVFPPSHDFDTAIEVIPVLRGRYGSLEPIKSRRGAWGVKTGYHASYDTYLSTILIRVPADLPNVSEAKVKAAYNRFFAEARTERLEDVLEIPFKDNSSYRKYGILFVFENGSGGSRPYYRLFDDYLCEDAVIRL